MFLLAFRVGTSGGSFDNWAMVRRGVVRHRFAREVDQTGEKCNTA